MFPVESLHPQYVEEQGAVYAARHQRALEQAAAQAAAQSAATSCTSSPALTPSASAPQPTNKAPQGPCPKTLTTALLNRQQTTRPSGGFFGNIIQGFSRANSGTVTPSLTRMPTPAREKSQAEIDALIAEQKRDADIVSHISVPRRPQNVHILTAI